MSSFLKLGMKCRWHLVTEWLHQYRDKLWWDSALPSRNTHDSALRRGLLYEASRFDRVHRCSVFLDLTTFYEAVDHDRLCLAAEEAGFPALLLHLALSAYRGGRIIVSDEVTFRVVYAKKGIIAGCPLAPTLSKLAIGGPVRRTCTGPSVDFVGTNEARRAASGIVSVYRRLRTARGLHCQDFLYRK